MVRLCSILLLAFTLPSSSFADGDKTDIVVLKNGDRITGEVKTLQARLLEFDTDAMGTVAIEWRYIEQVISTGNQSVDTTDGRRYFGKLTAVQGNEDIGVETQSGLVELDPDKVFSVWPVKSTFWERSDFDISLGFDYQKSTEIADLTLSVDWEHRKVDRLTTASLSTDITRQPSADDQQRSQLQFVHQFIRPNRQFNSWLGSAESNESLDLDYRVYAGGVYGKYLIRESNHWFSISGGLVATEEKYTGTQSTTSLEAVANAEFNLYRYADPERELHSTLTLFPSLTESGRLRTEFKTTFKLELINNLFWSMQLYYQNDNDPPSSTAVQTDYGVTTSVGWSP
jgi:hypothetical protein